MDVLGIKKLGKRKDREKIMIILMTNDTKVYRELKGARARYFR